MSSSSNSDSPVYPRQRKDYELRSRGSIVPRKEVSCTAMTKYSGKPSHELGHVPIASTSKISDPRAMLSLKRSNEVRNMHFDKGVKSRAFICAQAAAIVHSGTFQKSIEEDCELISNSSSNKENKPPKRKHNSISKPKNRLTLTYSSAPEQAVWTRLYYHPVLCLLKFLSDHLVLLPLVLKAFLHHWQSACLPFLVR